MTDTIAISQREDLNDLLLEMCRYGKPRVVLITEGWYCSINMHTTTTGTDFTISSDFYHATPIAAAKQCYERIVAAVKQLEAIAK
jgi:hypothetical protein